MRYLSLLLTMLICSGSPIPEFPFLKVKGESSLEVKPDKALIIFTVLHFSPDAKTASNSVNSSLKSLTESILKLGIKEEELEASDFTKNAKRKREENENTSIIGYEVSRDVTVTINQIDIYTPAIRTILAEENTTRVNSSFETSNKDNYLDQLMQEACKNAKKKAEMIAKASGVTLGRLQAVSDMEVANAGGGLGFAYEDDLFLDSSGLLPPSIGALYSVNEGGEAPVFAPAKIDLETRVTMLFRLD